MDSQLIGCISEDFKVWGLNGWMADIGINWDEE